jgi:hypothetical protein
MMDTSIPWKYPALIVINGPSKNNLSAGKLFAYPQARLLMKRPCDKKIQID